ncbi:MAG TPA: cobalamin-independent methionine synthase II family protein [Jiangellaceae bacterium]|nr:cobalamin-independent methionine synthase II family protein [Jiangellaceae bacterium]
MRNSSERILTSHAGSLPRPDDLIELNRARLAGEHDENAFQTRLRGAVVDLVQHQADTGIDVPNDGEFGHEMGDRVDYGAWWGYVFERLGGLKLEDATSLFEMPPNRSSPGNVQLTSFTDRRDWVAFGDAYGDPESGISVGGASRQYPSAQGPITYVGHDAVARDIANAKAAFAAAGVEEGFLNSVAPASAARVANDYYATEEEFIWACADALREEYKAIVDSGLILQLDDPAIAENWDQINPQPSVEDYQRFTMTRVEALNHAIRDLPADRIRFHLCWGSWHGPHTTDIPMRDIVDVILAINAGGYSFEAGNVRHEHEWKVWQDVTLPEGKVILPGVVSHATNVVEHPEVVADRIVRYAEAVGRENVIASSDCGLGGRVHSQIAWAKLDSLAKGAELATSRLWRSG